MRIPLNTDIAAGAVGVLIAAGFWLPQPELGRFSIAFPRAVLVAMFVLSFALIVRGFIRPSSNEVHIEGNPARLVTMIAALLLWWLGVRTVGYLTTSLVMFTAVTVYLARVQRTVTPRDLMLWIPIVAALVGGFYAIFIYALEIRPFGGWLV